MVIIFRCKRCKRVLETSHSLHIDDVIINVTPCDNLECRDCSTCDDAHRKKVQRVSDERGPQGCRNANGATPPKT